MSAQLSLAGLFPPDDDEKFCDGISWQPIPVRTIPLYPDFGNENGKLNQKYEAAREKYMSESPEIQKIYTEHADLFKHLTDKTGEDIETISDLYYLYNTLNIEKSRNLV